MRGEICIGAATSLSLLSVLLLIFAHIGQINTSTVPRGIAMVRVNMSAYGQALSAATGGDPSTGLYTNNASATLEQGAGLRQIYAFGLYSHCAYTDGVQGVCSNTSVANQFAPYSSVVADMPGRYPGVTIPLLAPTNLTFTNSHYLAEFSRAAYYLLLIGTICAFLAMVLGVRKRTLTYRLSAAFSIFGTLLLLIGIAIWTVIIHKSQSINSAGVQAGSPPKFVPLGIHVSVGAGLWLFWAGFVSLLLSTVPYMISCCTFRG